MEKPILLDFVSLSTIFGQRLYIGFDMYGITDAKII